MGQITVTIDMSKDGPSSRDTHSVSFALNGAGDYDSPAADTAARNLAGALGLRAPNRLWLTNINIRQDDLGASKAAMEGLYQNIDLSTQGSIALPAGAVLADKNTVVSFVRTAGKQRQGELRLRHFVTTEEVFDYNTSGATPERFAAGPGGFGAALIAAVTPSGYQHYLKGATRATRNSPRIVVGFFVTGIKRNDATRSRTSVQSVIVRAVQRQVNEAGNLARKLLDQAVTAADLAYARTRVTQLATLASNAIATLDTDLQPLVTKPEVFRNLTFA